MTLTYRLEKEWIRFTEGQRREVEHQKEKSGKEQSEKYDYEFSCFSSGKRID